MFDSNTPDPSRRTVVASAAGLLGAGLAGAGTLATAPGPAAALDGDPAAFEAGDAPTVVSNEGRIEAVYLAPELDVTWRDFGRGVEELDLTVAVGSDAGVDPVYEETLTAADTATESDDDADPGSIADVTFDDGAGFDAVDGVVTVAFERADATATGEAVTSERLSDPDLGSGESTATTLDVVVRADLRGAEGEDVSVVRTDTFDVAVENPAGDADAGGEANTDAD